MSSIAFIGLGNMGAPMALNLVKAGHSLKVYDLAPAAVKTLTDAGAKAAASAADAVQGAEVVISMLPASKHVEGLYLGEDLLGKIPASALVIECSTIAPDSARKVAQAAEARGIAMIDAPVSGGTGGAAPARSPSSSAACPPRWSAPVRCWKNGQEHLPRRRGGRGPGRQDLQQHAARHPDGRHLRGAGAGRGQWPGSQGAVGHHRQELGPQLGHRTLQPLARRDGTRARVQGLRRRLRRGPDAQDLGLAAEAALAARASIPLGELARNLYSLHSAGGSGKLDFSSIVNLLKRED